MELSDDTKNALVQLLAIRINNNLQNVTHTNKDKNDATVSPAKWNASFLSNTKQLCTAITGSAGVAAGNLVIQIWLGYDVRPQDANNTASIQFEDMKAGVDDTGSNGPYPEVFKSGTTPTVAYFAVEPGGSRPTYPANQYQEPKYPIYDGSTASPFPVNGAGTIVT